MNKSTRYIILSQCLMFLPTLVWGGIKLLAQNSARTTQGIHILLNGCKGEEVFVEQFAISPASAETNQGYKKYKVGCGRDGKFHLIIPSDTLYRLMVYPPEAVETSNGIESVNQERTIEVFGNAQTSMEVKARNEKDYVTYTCSSTEEINQACASFKSEDRKELAQGIQQALKARDYNRINALYDRRTAHKDNFRKSHPKSNFSAYLLTEVDDSTFLADLPLLTYPARNGSMKPALDARKQKLDYLAQINAQASNLQKEKQKAPEFTMPTIDGKTISLNDYKGKKYVILDFWGSWCVWCIKGMPHMKAFYKSHQDKIELIGVNCADKPNLCKASIIKNGMTWPQVVNLQDQDLVLAFGVRTYPTKVIITPDGYVDSIYEGESEDFYKHLEELLK